MMWVVLALTGCPPPTIEPESVSVQVEWSETDVVANAPVATLSFDVSPLNTADGTPDEGVMLDALSGLAVGVGCWTDQAPDTRLQDREADYVVRPPMVDAKPFTATLSRDELVDVAFSICDQPYGEEATWQPVHAWAVARFGTPAAAEQADELPACDAEDCTIEVADVVTLRICRSSNTAACGSAGACTGALPVVALDTPTSSDDGWVLRAWVDGVASGTVRFALSDDGTEPFVIVGAIEQSRAEAIVSDHLVDELDSDRDGHVEVMASYSPGCSRAASSEPAVIER